ncbi:MAG: DNA polymerase III subunit delta [Methylovirgula sp.]|uniref:DNA polymerase III subunit delta n=1 Tax=Methylovirgula sp. TaxID=1978224 RepID=UPI0030767B48
MVAVKNADADRFIVKPAPNIFLYLVFGTDAGLIAERAQKIIAAGVDDLKDPFEFLRISGDELAADPLRLADEANTIPMFGGRRAIAIDAQGKSFVAALEPILAKPPLDCTIVIEAGALKRDAPLRKLCESNPRAAALECYPDSAKDVAQLIDSELRADNLSIDSDARTLLISLLGEDRLTTRAEIAKLALYARGAGTITIGHIAAIVAEASSLALDTAIDGAFEGDLRAVEKTAERVFSEGGDYNALLGAALRHATALHRARLDAESGRGPGGGGGFGFRRSPAFERHVRAWPSERLSRTIIALNQAIGKARRDPRLADQIALRTLWSIALSARKKAG